MISSALGIQEQSRRSGFDLFSRLLCGKRICLMNVVICHVVSNFFYLKTRHPRESGDPDKTEGLVNLIIGFPPARE